jgi:hypothetical protein
MASMLYPFIRVVLDAIATSHSNEAKLRAEVLRCTSSFRCSSDRSSASDGSRVIG